MTKPVVSVVIPVYNGEKTIERALKSVFCQDEQNLEVIIVNDGSTDGSRELLDKLAADEPRLKVIHKVNEGVSVARNTGMDAATGEYLVFLDCDDEWEPNFLERALTLIRDNNVDAVRVRVKYVHPDHEVDGKVGLAARVYSGKQDMDLIRVALAARQDVPFSWLYLFRASAISGARYPRGIRCGEDLVFIYDFLSRLDSLLVADEPLYRYNLGVDSATGNPANASRNILSLVQVGALATNMALASSGATVAKRVASARLQKIMRDCIHAAGDGTLSRHYFRAVTSPRNRDFNLMSRNAASLALPYRWLVWLSNRESIWIIGWWLTLFGGRLLDLTRRIGK